MCTNLIVIISTVHVWCIKHHMAGVFVLSDERIFTFAEQVFTAHIFVVVMRMGVMTTAEISKMDNTQYS